MVRTGDDDFERSPMWVSWRLDYLPVVSRLGGHDCRWVTAERLWGFCPSCPRVLWGCVGSPVGLEIGESLVGVAETVELDAHAIHDREVEAGGFAVLVTALQIIEVPAGFEGAAGFARQDERHLVGTVGVAVEKV